MYMLINHPNFDPYSYTIELCMITKIGYFIKIGSSKSIVASELIIQSKNFRIMLGRPPQLIFAHQVAILLIVDIGHYISVT